MTAIFCRESETGVDVRAGKRDEFAFKSHKKREEAGLP